MSLQLRGSKESKEMWPNGKPGFDVNLPSPPDVRATFFKFPHPEMAGPIIMTENPAELGQPVR
jgi:hypothetical protein